MTDKIKSAREAFIKEASWYNFQYEHIETILEALSAYERLQGVDRDRLLVDLQVLEDMVRIPDIPAMSCLRKAAQLVADIRGK